MAKIISVSEAASRLGVTSQTIRNWAEKGVLKIKKIGKAHYVDGTLIDQIGDFSSDVVKAQEALEKLRQDIIDERHKEHLALYDKVAYRRYTNLCVEASIRSGFFVKVLELLTEYGSLNQREMEILRLRLEGTDLESVCDIYGLTRERVRQISEKAIRKSRDINTLCEEIRNIDAMKANVAAMKNEIASLKAQLHIQNEKEAEDLRLTEEEKRNRIIENDSLCKILSTRLVDCELTVRSLNCLKAYRDEDGYKDIETIGDLCKLHKIDLLKQRNFGKKSLTELDDLLEFYNLQFGMDVDKIYKERVDYLMNI